MLWAPTLWDGDMVLLIPRAASNVKILLLATEWILRVNPRHNRSLVWLLPYILVALWPLVFRILECCLRVNPPLRLQNGMSAGWFFPYWNLSVILSLKCVLDFHSQWRKAERKGGLFGITTGNLGKWLPLWRPSGVLTHTHSVNKATAVAIQMDREAAKDSACGLGKAQNAISGGISLPLAEMLWWRPPR